MIMKLRRHLSLLLLGLFAFSALAADRPKLVVGLVVDQMRWDYLHRFADRYTEGGFKRLLREGYSYDNTMIDYIPTITAIGHTSIYTGTVPSIHGIAGNSFRQNGAYVYCTEDTTVRGVGADNDAGQMSPRRMLTTTIGDELRLATNFRSRVISISLKDRASILPGGHTSNGSYWFDKETGHFITSTFYMDKLPQWVSDFNKQNLAKKYLDQDWHTLFPIDTYKESTADDVPYEGTLKDLPSPTFPIPTSRLYKKNDYGVIRQTPYGNSFTLDMARAALAAEKLGQGTETDMIAVSLSATDYIGHLWGINAIELEDTYLRLDRDLERFLKDLDKQVGKGNYLLFLTADHAAAHNFTFLQDHKIPGAEWYRKERRTELNKQLAVLFGHDKLVETIMNYQVFLNQKAMTDNNIDSEKVKAAIISILKKDPGVAYVADQEKALTSSIPEPIRSRMVNGYNHERSGEIQIILKPGWYSNGSPTGTQHAVWCPYDSHIPLLFMGWRIPQGKSNRPTRITDIAPTVTSLLNVQRPNGAIGEPLPEVCP